MVAGPDTLLRYIHRLVVRAEPDQATDAALLGRYIAARDESAFAALVDRHGPLVLQVCRRVLGDGADTEDAFQAVFLVLARKAAGVGRREALPAWLHGVARRVALKARSARARRLGAEIGESDKGAELSLKLVEDLPVDGRLLDQDRKPVAGARVAVIDVSRDSEEAMKGFLEGDFKTWSPKSWRGPFPEQSPAVPTDADGRFRVTGLGRGRVVRFAHEGSAIWHNAVVVVTQPPAETGAMYGAAFEHAARPGRSIRGVVRDQATGKPVAGVKISVPFNLSTALTDQDGRYELPGCPKENVHRVQAQPPGGQSYFAASVEVPDGPGLDPLTADLELVSGLRVRGWVTDQATQKPPRAAVVQYFPLFTNPHSTRLTNAQMEAASSALVQPDGSFSLVGLPGPGVVCVAASPRNSYAVALVEGNELANLFHDGKDHGGGDNLYTAEPKGKRGKCCVNSYHALALINPDERMEALALDLTVQPARSLKGRVVGPDGKPLTGVKVVGLTALGDEEILEGASFTVRGLNPRRSRALYFDHAGKGLRKALTIPGDATEPLTVQLGP